MLKGGEIPTGYQIKCQLNAFSRCRNAPCTVLLQVLLRQQPGGKNRVHHGATSFDDAPLIGWDGSDVLEVLVQYPVKIPFEQPNLGGSCPCLS